MPENIINTLQKNAVKDKSKSLNMNIRFNSVEIGMINNLLDTTNIKSPTRLIKSMIKTYYDQIIKKETTQN